MMGDDEFYTLHVCFRYRLKYCPATYCVFRFKLLLQKMKCKPLAIGIMTYGTKAPSDDYALIRQIDPANWSPYRKENITSLCNSFFDSAIKPIRWKTISKIANTLMKWQSILFISR